MAGTLRIATKDQSITVDILDGIFKIGNERQVFEFLDNTDGLSVRNIPIGLVGRGNYWSMLVPEKERLERLMQRLYRWHGSKLSADSVWLEWYVDSEASKRALLYSDSRLKEFPGLGTYPFQKTDSPLGIMLLDLSIQIHPVWEEIGVSNTYNGTELDYLGGTMIVSTYGTRPGRIQKLTLSGLSSLTSARTYWIGIRPFHDGQGSFTPVWELESGTVVSDTSSGTVSGASGGSAMTTTFATDEALVERVVLRINQVLGSNFHHMRGRYHVLLRYKASTSSASSFGVQIRTGYYNSTRSAIVLPVQTIDTDDTSFHLLELGTVDLPPGTRFQAEGNDIGYGAIGLWLERISGSASFISDCLVLIPADHYVKIEGVGEASVSSITEVFTHENDEITGLESDSNGPARNLALAPNNWYAPYLDKPADGCKLVVVVESAGGISELEETVDIDLEVIDRWTSHRTTT